MKNSDFISFTNYCSWLFKPGSPVDFADENDMTFTLFESQSPILFQLLNKARLLHFQVEDLRYRLYSWDNKQGESCGWLTKMESNDTYELPFIDTHKVFLEQLGGIVYTYNSDDDFLTNSQSFFSSSICQQGIGEIWSKFYLQRCEEDNCIPLEHQDWIVFGREAGGHYTLYDQYHNVYMFNTDPGEAYLEVIENQPSATFFSIKNAPTFEAYVELLAKQWLDWVV